MPKAAKASKKSNAPAPYAKKSSKPQNPLFEKSPRNYGVGNAVQPKRNLSRMVKWPKYVRMQRQRRVLYQRLKVPPTVAQFTNTLDKNTAMELFKLLNKYRPESSTEKKTRLSTEAQSRAAGSSARDTKKPVVVKFGINHVTELVEKREARLVVIAHDVDPIELVLWLPALCRKCGVPYCIVKSKSRLGEVVHQKTATALAVTGVRNEDSGAFAKLVDSIKANFNERYEDLRKRWGGGIMGIKSQHKEEKKAKAIAAEERKRIQ